MKKRLIRRISMILCILMLGAGMPMGALHVWAEEPTEQSSESSESSAVDEATGSEAEDESSESGETQTETESESEESKEAKKDVLPEVSAPWSNFRGSSSNMAITSTALPTEKDTVKLQWNRKFGSGWDSAPSVQIIVDNSLVVMAGKKIYKLNLKTGETLASGDMAAAPNWGYTPPTYGAGMIFCPLSGGRVQAFNAKTLKSLWIYKDPLGGQSISPITYKDGYIYTGFWTGETKDANYVCLDVSDEDTNSSDEAKEARWSVSHKGGYYWAGSVVLGDAVIVGTEDGVTGTGDSEILSLDKRTGRQISSIILKGMGDQRASIAWAAEKKRVYFCTAAGYVASAAVNTTTGVLSDLKSSKAGSSSTGTPVVYKGRVYFGVGGSVTSSGSSGCLVVADADSLKTLYTVPMQGYPQCSMLLSTAHESEGYLYLYSTYNSKPGGITMVRIDPTKETADGALLKEIYDAKGFSEFCITSPICSDSGIIYYKNDSGNVLAVGITDKTSEPEETESEETDPEETDPAAEKIAHVEELIGKIGTVDGTAGAASRVKAARKAYDALSKAEKAQVKTYQTLTAAEKQQTKYDNARAVEKKISEIGTVDKSAACKKRVAAARTAYDALLASEKKIVQDEKYYAKLQAAESKLKSSTTSGTTHTISGTSGTSGTVTGGSSSTGTNTNETTAADGDQVELYGKIYTVEDPEARALIETIKELAENEDSITDDSIYEAYRSYDAMEDAVKAQVLNYSDLKIMCLRVGSRNHTIGGEEQFGWSGTLPWYVRVQMERIPMDEDTDADSLVAAIGNMDLLALYQVDLIDCINGGTYTLPAELQAEISSGNELYPEEMNGSYEMLRTIMFDDEDRPLYGEAEDIGDALLIGITGSGELFLVGTYGESALELPEDEMMPEEALDQTEEAEEKEGSGGSGTLIALLITLGSTGLMIWLSALVNRKNRE